MAFLPPIEVPVKVHVELGVVGLEASAVLALGKFMLQLQEQRDGILSTHLEGDLVVHLPDVEQPIPIAINDTGGYVVFVSTGRKR